MGAIQSLVEAELQKLLDQQKKERPLPARLQAATARDEKAKAAQAEAIKKVASLEEQLRLAKVQLEESNQQAAAAAAELLAVKQTTGEDLAAVTLASMVAAVQQALCPPGTVLPYMGATAPTGWLVCNGASVLRATYPSLFAVIGTSCGTSSSTYFNLPDFRGRFLRGWDNATGRDPDRGARTAMATGGATGDAIGSVQTDEFKKHSHTLTNQIAYMSEGNDSSGGYYDPVLENRNSGDTGGGETRPINASVNYIIKF